MGSGPGAGVGQEECRPPAQGSEQRDTVLNPPHPLHAKGRFDARKPASANKTNRKGGPNGSFMCRSRAIIAGAGEAPVQDGGQDQRSATGTRITCPA